MNESKEVLHSIDSDRTDGMFHRASVQLGDLRVEPEHVSKQRPDGVKFPNDALRDSLAGSSELDRAVPIVQY